MEKRVKENLSPSRGIQLDPTDYEASQARVEEVCKIHHSEIAERYEQFWPSENFQNVLGHADVFVNRQAGFLWCRVPKAASVSWTTIFVNKW